MKDKRDILVELLGDPHHRATADSILNALHQGGWATVPKAGDGPCPLCGEDQREGRGAVWA